MVSNVSAASVSATPIDANLISLIVNMAQIACFVTFSENLSQKLCPFFNGLRDCVTECDKSVTGFYATESAKNRDFVTKREKHSPI